MHGKQLPVVKKLFFKGRFSGKVPGARRLSRAVQRRTSHGEVHQVSFNTYSEKGQKLELQSRQNPKPRLASHPATPEAPNLLAGLGTHAACSGCQQDGMPSALRASCQRERRLGRAACSARRCGGARRALSSDDALDGPGSARTTM